MPCASKGANRKTAPHSLAPPSSTVSRSRRPKKGALRPGQYRLRWQQESQRTQTSCPGRLFRFAATRLCLCGRSEGSRRSQGGLIRMQSGLFYPPASVGGWQLHRLSDRVGAGASGSHSGDCQALRRPERVCRVAASLGSGAHVCLVRAVSSVRQGL